MAFIVKHLSDPFFLNRDQRFSLRDNIFREVVANILIHRDFVSAFPAKLIIEPSRVVAENANKPHGQGAIDPRHFSPYPKNPVIARFFREISWAEELGSGLRNLFKYCRQYSLGDQPEFIEGDIFKTVIPLGKNLLAGFSPQDTPQGTPQVILTDLENQILRRIEGNIKISQKELADDLEIGFDTVKEYIKRLKQKKVLGRKGKTSAGYWIIRK